MNNIKRITSFTCHKTGEGRRISVTYSEITEDGTLAKSNERFDIIVLNEEQQKYIEALEEFLYTKMPE